MFQVSWMSMCLPPGPCGGRLRAHLSLTSTIEISTRSFPCWSRVGLSICCPSFCSITLLWSVHPLRKSEKEVQSSLPQIHLSCRWEASLNYHFAGTWWRGDTSTPRAKEACLANLGGCKIRGDDGAGKRDLGSSLSSTSQKHTGCLSPRVCVLVLHSPRICVKAVGGDRPAGAGCPFAWGSPGLGASLWDTAEGSCSLWKGMLGRSWGSFRGEGWN